jgi:hypothetical protein
MHDQQAPIQPWRQNKDVMKILNSSMDAKAEIVVGCARANPYPAGAMMLNGGQSAGHARQEIIYDTGDVKKDQTDEAK